MSQETLPVFKVDYLGEKKGIPPFGITISGLTPEDAQKVKMRLQEHFPNYKFHFTDGTTFHTAMDTGREVIDYVQKLETRMENGKLVPDMNFQKPSSIRNEISSVERLHHIATGVLFDIKSTEGGVQITLNRLPEHANETLDAASKQMAPHRSMYIPSQRQAQIIVYSWDDAKACLNKLKHQFYFSEGEHVLSAKIDQAQKEAFKKEQGKV